MYVFLQCTFKPPPKRASPDHFQATPLRPTTLNQPQTQSTVSNFTNRPIAGPPTSSILFVFFRNFATTRDHFGGHLNSTIILASAVPSSLSL